MSVFLLLAIVFTFPSAEAADTCEFIPEYTCSDAVLNPGDGSGPLYRDNNQGKATVKMLEKGLKDLTKDFQKALLSKENPPSDLDVELAISATGSNLAPACKRVKEGAELSFACARILAKSLARRVSGEIFYENNNEYSYYFTEEGLKDEVLLRSTALYTSVKDSGLERIKKSTEAKALEVRVERNFKKSREYINEIIDAKVVDKKTKKLLKAKVNSIRFKGLDCAEGVLDNQFIKNAFYNSRSNSFSYCKGFAFNGTSDYQILQAVTHELSHSIDPCNIQVGPRTAKWSYKTNSPEAEYPIDVLSCLRSEGSVQAVSQQQGVFFRQAVSEGGATTETEKRPFCNSNDQINESFPDWMGAEVLAKYMERDLKGATQQQYIDGIASVFRPVCNDLYGLGPSKLGQSDGGPHPALRDRVSHILLAQPKIRRMLGCEDLSKTGIKYCDFNRGRALNNMGKEISEKSYEEYIEIQFNSPSESRGDAKSVE